ncbi:unnamed protein product [Meloidogyne enterolobii]|uniref:Uncharacterized protein n=1 Tax=Meloidogyne enterolobii TaxID=390850 RepID=A0ACB1B6W1_MELEN
MIWEFQISDTMNVSVFFSLVLTHSLNSSGTYSHSPKTFETVIYLFLVEGFFEWISE